VKKKDLFYLLLAVVIIMVAGYVGYTQLVPKQATAKEVTVEKVGIIPDKFDDDGIKWLSDDKNVQDFDSPVDLSGLGNPTPFGQ
jgi:hypothetical protein